MKIYRQNETTKLAEILKNDGVISVPTDTVYGLCARICSKKAYDNLIKIKNRPYNKPLPVMCADEEQIKSIAIVNEKAKLLISNFMPGPITVILPKKPEVSDYITNGKNTIAIRMATSKCIEELIRKTECPIFISSANQSGQPACTSLYEIEKSCPTLDGIMEGEVFFGKSSTIVDCTSDNIKILREGPILLKQILEIIEK